jgi:hypothetical protein
LDVILKPIWKNANNRIVSEANELIIIGCSLNENDAELIKLVNKFVNKMGSKQVKVIYKKEGSDNFMEEHFKKIIGNDLKIYDHGFNILDKRSKSSSIKFIFEG